MKRLALFVVTFLVFAGSAQAGPWVEGRDWGSRLPAWRVPVFPRQPQPSANGAGVYSAPYGADALTGARFLGPARLQTMSANVGLQLRDEFGLLRYAQLVSNPRSPYYRHFLTPTQIADRFGASRADYARTVQYFAAHGLAVQGWRQREMIRVIGSQASMERAFGTRFGTFQRNGIVFYAPLTAPRFGSPLPVSGIGGLENFHRMYSHMRIGVKPRPWVGFGPGLLIGNSPFDIAAAFDYTGAYNINGSCCKGDGVTIGIVGTGPISSADVPAFRNMFGISGNGAVHQVNVTQVMTCCYSTGLQTPPPVTGPCSGPLPACNPEDNEAQLDTEQTSSLAPDATVNFYLAYNPNECGAPGACPSGSGSPQIGVAESDDELQQIASDNVADVISGSYGSPELDFAVAGNPIVNNTGNGADPIIFATLATEGIAVFFSSGDNGAESCMFLGSPNPDAICMSYPATDPSVTAVGGLTTPIGSNGRLTGIITTWGVQTQGGGAGGGGFSSVFPRPAYQPAGNVCAAPPNNSLCDNLHRLVPDVSLNSDPATGDTFLIDCGPGPSCSGLGGAMIGSIGGTSAAAPDMAAMWALVLEACKQTPSCNNKGPAGHAYRLGNPAPLLYQLSPALSASAFLDITYGLNAVPSSTSFGNYAFLDPGFSAGPGYDAATGLGAPFARNLIHAIVGI